MKTYCRRVDRIIQKPNTNGLTTSSELPIHHCIEEHSNYDRLSANTELDLNRSIQEQDKNDFTASSGLPIRHCIEEHSKDDRLSANTELDLNRSIQEQDTNDLTASSRLPIHHCIEEHSKDDRPSPNTDLGLNRSIQEQNTNSLTENSVTNCLKAKSVELDFNRSAQGSNNTDNNVSDLKGYFQDLNIQTPNGICLDLFPQRSDVVPSISMEEDPKKGKFSSATDPKTAQITITQLDLIPKSEHPPQPLDQANDSVIDQRPFVGIEPLTVSNYSQWRMRVDITLGCMNYDFVLTEDMPEVAIPTSPESVKAHYAKWEKANRMAMMIIRESISEPLRGGIQVTKTARELLAVIQKQFIANNMSLQYNYLARLMALKYDGSGSVREHILRMSHLATNLRETGINFDDAMLVHMVVLSLPNSFETFKVNYSTKETKWDLHQLTTSCVIEEEHLKGSRVKSTHLVIASESKKTFKKRGFKKERKKDQSSGSKRKFEKASRKMPKKTEKVDCWFCKKQGHMKNDCYKYKELIKKNKGV